MTRDFPGASFDSWKTTEPDNSRPEDDTRCPHGEDGCDGDPYTLAEDFGWILFDEGKINETHLIGILRRVRAHRKATS